MLLLFLFVCVASHADAQKKQGQHIIDSLLKELSGENFRNRADTSKINLLNTLSMDFASLDDAEGVKYGQQSLELAEKLHWKKGIAGADNSLAANYFHLPGHAKSLEYFSAAIKIYEDAGDKKGLSAAYSSMAGLYSQQSDYRTALRYLQKQLKVDEGADDKMGQAVAYRDIGLAYSHMNDFQKALDNQLNSLKMADELGDKKEIARTMGQISIVYEDMGDYTNAKEYLFKALKMSNTSSIADFYNSIGEYPSALGNEFKAFKKREELGNIAATVAIESNNGLSYKDHDDSAKALEYMFKEALSYEYEKKEAAAQTDEERQQLKYMQELKEKQIEYEFSQKIAKSEAQQQQKEQERLHQEAIEKINREKNDAITREQLKREKNILYASISGAVLLLIIALTAIAALRQKRRDNITISKEKQRSEELLLNILPAEVAEELKEKGSAEARQFEHVTVLFTDFVGFTQASERMDPTALINELHTCFKAFDDITAKYHIEKIKTIGDAYLAVCGLPMADTEHAKKVVAAAKEIRTFMQQRYALLGDKTFQIRIGVHSGTVVAGIVGVRKFAYDIWGDTVNTAARMQENSEAGEVNISETTYKMVKDDFECRFRGEIAAKNKGMMKMYYVS